MDLKKHIKLKEELTEEPQFTAEDQILLDSLTQHVTPNSVETTAVKRRVNLWKVFAPVATVAAALVITLTCVFVPKGTQEVFYQEENIINREATFTEMQTDLKYFDLSQLEVSTYETNLSYDSVSNDKLYYELKSEYNFSIVYLSIVINENYNYNFGTTEEIANKKLNDYTISYQSESDRGGISCKYKGWIKVKTETLYFNYTQTPTLGDEAFFDSIQEIVKLK